MNQGGPPVNEVRGELSTRVGKRGIKSQFLERGESTNALSSRRYLGDNSIERRIRVQRSQENAGGRVLSADLTGGKLKADAATGRI